jgi:hypothetical protein
MWDENDKQYYDHLTSHNIGQICNDPFSNEIVKYASDVKYKTFLEIGTWNGLGSTKAFSNGFMNRKDDYIFYSLECNKDKCDEAANLYTNNNKIHILNEVIWNKEPSDFYTIFPQCRMNEMYKHWNEVDMINMKMCNLFLDRPNLPDLFDVVLLDGGEFTTYYEFQLLKDRCKILMLDDINVDKCKLIVKEIENDSSWKIIKKENIRNGFLIAEKITENCNTNITNIVVSRYNNNVDFVYKINNNKNINIMIYDKENPDNPLNIPVNKGNEAAVYLKYIIDYYDELTDFTFFIHDEEFSWHHTGSIIDKYNEAIMSNELYYNINDKAHWNKPNLIEEYIYNELLKWYNEYVEEYIPISKVPNNKDFIYNYYGCAQFLVHKDLIRNLPKEFYMKLYNWIITTNIPNEISGRFLEWTWHVFWVIYPKYIKR